MPVAARRNVRGQATTELALGSLVFVVVLLFGIYFGELPVVMLKVKEAANFAVTHGTGSRTHMFNTGNIGGASTFAPFDPAKVGADTRDRYRDFDGMSDRSGGNFNQVMTSTRALRSRCRSDSRLSFAVARRAGTQRAGAGGQGAYDATFNYLDNRYRDRGGLSCTVTAQSAPFRMPTSFVDNGPGAMAQEQLPDESKLTLALCGAGKPVNNTCRGELLVLTGDWAFDGPIGSRPNEDVESVQDGPSVNDPYQLFVQQLYQRNGDSQGSAGRRLMEVVAGVTSARPEYLDESIFNMSFSGAENVGPVSKVERVLVDPATPRALKYQTSGADMRSNYVSWNETSGVASGIPTCFLGLAGCDR